MKNSIKAYSTLFAIVASTVFFGCKKEDEQVQRSVERHVAQETQMEAAFEDSDNLAGSAIQQRENNERIGATLDGDVCASTTVSFNAETRTVTIDFGTGCTSPRGIERRGKMIITYTGRYGQLGTVITTTFENYSVNGIKIEGNRTLTNKGFSNGGITFDVRVQNGRLTWPDGSTATLNLNHERTWIIVDNSRVEYRITGSSSGTNRNGETFSSQITEPLTYTLECILEKINIPVKGVKKVNLGDRPELTIDFGNGTCDKEVTISNGERTWTITVD